MTNKGKWIEFKSVPAFGKTSVWVVGNSEKQIALGEIKWYGAWRKYCFFPLNCTLYEEDCLRDIANFCESQTKAYRDANFRRRA